MVGENIFREYDVRANAEGELTDAFCLLAGKACGTYLKRHGRVAVFVGHDNRLSSERINKAFIEGLVATGMRVVDLGETLSPIVYFAAKVDAEIDTGIVITASHNGPEMNGFKLVMGEQGIFGAELLKIKELMELEDFEEGVGGTEYRNVTEKYFADLAGRLNISERKLKVVVDCGNGTASSFAPALFERLGAEVVPLYCESDGSFPNHNPDPVVPENTKELAAKVVAVGADLGIGIDGDADRLGLVDEKGEMIWGDSIMTILARDILPQHPGAKVIVEVKSSQALVDEVNKLGGEPIIWKTGHSLVKAKMKEEGAILAGEMSGHLYIADAYYGYDDALYAAGRIMQILAKNKEKSVSELLAGVNKYFNTPEIRIKCADEHKLEVVSRVVEDFKQKFDVLDIDGARVQFADGWGLVRASNTQPAIIVRAEGNTPEALERIKGIVKEELDKFTELKLEW